MQKIQKNKLIHPILVFNMWVLQQKMKIGLRFRKCDNLLLTFLLFICFCIQRMAFSPLPHLSSQVYQKVFSINVLQVTMKNTYNNLLIILTIPRTILNVYSPATKINLFSTKHEGSKCDTKTLIQTLCQFDEGVGGVEGHSISQVAIVRFRY